MSQSEIQDCIDKNLTYNAAEDNYLSTGLLSLQIALCVTSGVASLVNVIIFSRPRMFASSLIVLLFCIEMSNLLFALHILPYSVMLFAYIDVFLNKPTIYAVCYLTIASASFVCFTVWMTVLTGVWRCVAVTRPLQARNLLTKTKALFSALILLCICFAVNSVVFVTTNKIDAIPFKVCKLDSNKENKGGSAYYISGGPPNTALKGSLVILFAFYVVPALLSVVVTVCLVWRIRVGLAIRKKLKGSGINTPDSSIRATKIIATLLFAFLICNAIPYISTAATWQHLKRALPAPWDTICDNFHFGLIINTLSFFGYYFMGTKFRKTFYGVFCCQSSSRSDLLLFPAFRLRERTLVNRTVTTSI